MTELFNLVVSALAGGLVSAIYPHVRQISTRPNLSVDYQKDDAHFVDFDWVKPGVGDISAVYIRVRIQNLGVRVAKGVRVFLTGLEKVQDFKAIPTELHDALLLRWPGGPDCAPRDLPRGVEFYADVVSFSKKTPGWGFCVKEMYANHTQLPAYRGTYRFHILATAENADPAQCMIDITYEGEWRSVRAVPAYRDPSDRVTIEIRI
jgi:hypothetical protein